MTTRTEGRQIYTGTIASSASFAYLQPLVTGTGTFEVLATKLCVALVTTITMGGTLPSTRGVVTLYLRRRSTDTAWAERKIYQTPTVAGKSQPFVYYLDTTIWEYKFSATGGTGQSFDLVIEEGSFDP